MELYVYKPPSSEFYKCCHCRHKLPFRNRKDIDFLFCPYCAKSLNKDDLNKTSDADTKSSNSRKE